MKNDRLRHDAAEIHNPDDLIDARSEGRSHFARDVDAFEEDMDLSEDIDVDHDLTFPHPKDKHGRDRAVPLMGTPNELDSDGDWDAQDAQPTDYEHDYSDGTNAYATDNPDEIIEEEMHVIGHVTSKDISEEEPTEVMSPKFSPDEETGQ
jgi:hypothetical protein